MFMRLNENNQVVKDLNKVFDKMTELGIRIEIGPYGRIEIHHPNGSFNMFDLEASPADDREGIYEFPPVFEYKLVYEQ